jgi:hypothetical protein
MPVAAAPDPPDDAPLGDDGLAAPEHAGLAVENEGHQLPPETLVALAAEGVPADEVPLVEGRAARQLALLEKDDVTTPGGGQVVSDAAADDPAADDDDRRVSPH